ncbi:MAG: hypothetical protein AAF604_16320 [Acidobacteriota bacterium]
MSEVAASVHLRRDLGPAKPSGRLGRWLLRLLLLALIAGALTIDRSSWPALVGDEATYAMQAASLAFDFDLRYEAVDYERFVADWGRKPEGLILQSRDGGARITFGKPFLYALYLAPFVRLAPVQGPLVANALLLALTALVSARVLRRRLGPSADAWVAVFCFASVTFAYTFWVHADLFLMCTTALGLAVLDRPRRGAQELYRGEDELSTGRWLLGGALLAVAAAFRPFYLAFLLPALVALPRRRRGVGALALLAGVVLTLGLSSGGQWLAGGSWTGYGGERQGFYDRTGYPGVDFPADQWSQSVERWGNTSWLHEGALERPVDASLTAWNSLYFLVGRNVGVLPYFLPLLVGLFAFRGGVRGWSLLLAVGLAVAVLFWLRPFNFFGGGGTLANRYFLPLYPAFWFLAERPVRAAWAPLMAVLAGLFLFPLWLGARDYPIGDDGRYGHVAPLAQRFLPYETSQSHIPGGRDVNHRGLWIKFPQSGARPRDGGARLELDGARQGELLIGSPQPLESLVLSFGRQAPSVLEVEGGELGDRLLRGTGGVAFTVLFDRPRAVHPMWWTWEDVYLYRLRLRLPEAPPLAMPFTISTAGWSTENTPHE